MKNWKLSLYLSAAFIAISSVLPVNEVKAQGYYDNQEYYGNEVSFDMFYYELAPYGHWDYDRTYGDIWYPNVGRNFRPYSTNGYWTMTEYGNTWVSNYSWGWATFHYGRWVHNSHRGWGWIPGYEWGPAWVDWRAGNGYYGWAPMMPGGIHISINIPVSAWVFAPIRHLYSTNNRYSNFGRTNIYNNTTIINNTYIVNNNRYYGGPSRSEIERSLGRRVEVRKIQVSDRPSATRVDRNAVSIFRPNNSNNTKPSRITRDSDGRIIENATTRRTEANNTNRVNTTPVERNNTDINRPQRELHIDRNGNTTIKERQTNTTNRTSTNVDRNSSINSTRTNISRTTTTESNNSTRNETVKQPQVDRQSRGTAQRLESNQPQTRQREATTQRPTQVQQPQRSQPTTTAPSARRESSASSSSMSRSTAPATNRSSTTASSRGSQEGNSERSRR